MPAAEKLTAHVARRAKQAGGLRPLARVTGIDAASLCKMRAGSRITADDITLQRLGLDPVPRFVVKR